MLRKAHSDDFSEIFEIYMDPSINPYMSWEIMTQSEFQPIFNDLLASQSLYVYEPKDAQSKKEILAVIRIERKKHRLSHTVYIGGFGIKTSCQNQGLGAKIMQEALLKITTEMPGVQRIELIVEGDNPRAIRLYKKLGFEVEGTLRRYFKRKSDQNFVDDLYMALLVPFSP